VKAAAADPTLGFVPRAMLLEALLRRFCEEHGLDPGKVLAMLDGAPAPTSVVYLFHDKLGLSPAVWPRRERLVSAEGKRYTPGVTLEQRTEILRRNARRRRRYPTHVHRVLDTLNWTIAQLTERVSAELGYSVSRPSMQFWATGTRQVIKKGKSVPHACAAPWLVREAAKRVTVREAVSRHLGEAAILEPKSWPNVEDED
jgi:hypothetical protein